MAGTLTFAIGKNDGSRIENATIKDIEQATKEFVQTCGMPIKQACTNCGELVKTKYIVQKGKYAGFCTDCANEHEHDKKMYLSAYGEND